MNLCIFIYVKLFSLTSVTTLCSGGSVVSFVAGSTAREPDEGLDIRLPKDPLLPAYFTN